MAQQLQLQTLPKQQITAVLTGTEFEIEIIETAGVMSMNFTRGGTPGPQGCRVVAGQMVIPFIQQEAGLGNFIFITNNDDIPFWTNFNIDQNLYYVSNAELEVIRNGTG